MRLFGILEYRLSLESQIKELTIWDRWLSQFDRKNGPQCEECGEELADSHLFRNFNLEVCDKCKETEKDGKHELITKTDAKNEFLLKDTDFVRPEPALKFIARKNPHKESWGEMKLYLRY